MQYSTVKMGSRKAQTHFYFDGKSHIQVACEEFHGNLEEFEECLEDYEEREEFRAQYLKEIQKVKALFELNA